MTYLLSLLYGALPILFLIGTIYYLIIGVAKVYNEKKYKYIYISGICAICFVIVSFTSLHTHTPKTNKNVSVKPNIRFETSIEVKNVTNQTLSEKWTNTVKVNTDQNNLSKSNFLNLQ